MKLFATCLGLLCLTLATMLCSHWLRQEVKYRRIYREAQAESEQCWQEWENRFREEKGQS